MIDLKPYFDAAQAADIEVQRIMNEMNEHFNAGTEEGKQAALDMRPALDEAKAKAADANSLYLSMRDAAAQSNSAARTFVPVSETKASNEGAKEIILSDFNALDDTAKLKFMRGGGTIKPESD
ncbi:MAG: hypothetical protein ACYCXH_07235 [Bellilinea sp.]